MKNIFCSQIFLFSPLLLIIQFSPTERIPSSPQNCLVWMENDEHRYWFCFFQLLVERHTRKDNTVFLRPAALCVKEIMKRHQAKLGSLGDDVIGKVLSAQMWWLWVQILCTLLKSQAQAWWCMSCNTSVTQVLRTWDKWIMGLTDQTHSQSVGPRFNKRVYMKN